MGVKGALVKSTRTTNNQNMSQSQQQTQATAIQDDETKAV